MKLRFIFSLVLIWFSIYELGAQQFDYSEKWREVYKMEIQGLSKSVSQKIDSIYAQAVAENNNFQKLRATIYQSKYRLLLEENAQESVLNMLTERAESAKAPFHSIYHFLKANSLFEYYQSNTYQIRNREIEENDTSDFNFWGQQRFLKEIHTLFSKALDTNENLHLDDQSIRVLFETDSLSSYQGLALNDWIATKAIELYFFQPYQNPIQWKNENWIWNWGDFSQQDFSSKNGYNREHGLVILQQMGEKARNSGSKELITFWELHRLKTLSNLNLKNKDQNLIQAYRHLLGNPDIQQSPLKLTLALKLNSLSNEYGYQQSNEFENTKIEAHQLASEIINSGEKNLEVAQAKSLIQLIEQPSIDGQIQSFIMPETHSRVLVSYANLEEINIRIYKPTAQEWLSLNNIYVKPDMSGALGKIEPVRSLNQRLPQQNDFNIHSTELLIEPLQKGQYTIAFYSSQEPQELLGFAHFQVSELILADLGNDVFNHFALVNRENGEAISGAKIHFFSENAPYRVTDLFLHTFTSDSNGRFYVKSKNYQYGLGATVIDQSDTTYFQDLHLSSNRWSGSDDEDYYMVQADVFTDRAIYRPGQTVYFKGILSKSKGSEQGVVTNEEVVVTIYDVNYDEVYEKYLKTNEFGSFSDSLKLPKNVLTGRFRIEVEEGDAPSVFFEEKTDEFYTTNVSFSVENYKRPKFELVMDPIDSAYTLGDSVTVSGSAKALAGNSLANAQLKYTVTQKGYRAKTSDGNPYFWQRNWVEDEQVLVSTESQIGQDGEFKIKFATHLKDGLIEEQLPIYEYQVEVSVTDINGETRESSKQVKVGLHKATSSVFAKRDVLKKEKVLKVNVSASNLNGGDFKESGTLKVYRLDAKHYLFNRQWSAPDLPVLTEEEFEKYFPNEPYAENSTEPAETLVYETEVGINQTEVEIQGIAQWYVGSYLLRFQANRKLAEPVSANFTLKESTDQVLYPQFISVLADKTDYKVGETAKLTISSSLKDLTILLQPKKINAQNTEYIFRLNERTETLEIPIKEDDLGGFEVHYLAIGAHHSETGTLAIRVPQPKAELEIETKTFRSLLEPGSEETWSFNIKGTKGKAAEAEVLASMYDASLDQFASNDWIYNPSSQRMFNTNNHYSTFPRYNFSSIRNVIPFFRADFKQRSLPTFQSFGYSFVNTRISHSQYLYDLLSNSPTHVMSRKEEGIPVEEIWGIVRDELGEPLFGVNIKSNAGEKATTKVSGRFSIKASQSEEITMYFLGYKTLNFKVDENNFYEVSMSPDFQELGEVVVVGYVQESKKEMLFSVVNEEVEADEPLELKSRLQGVVGGIAISSDSSSHITIRGLNSIDKSKQPLVVVDGVITTLDQVSSDDVANISALNNSTATALYGSRAVNGVILISTKAGLAKEKELLANVRTRTDFRETAFFFPHLRTDKKGHINFSFSAPESLTRWKFQMLAHTKNLAYKHLVSTVQTSKSLMVVPNLPRFVRAGDTLVVSAKVVNTGEKPIQASAQLNLINPEKEETLNLFVLASKSVQRQFVGAKNSAEVFWQIAVPENVKALQYKVVATGDGFSDGEENYLPVLPKKVLVTESLPIWVAADTVQNFQLPALLNKKEGTTDVSLKLELTKNPVWSALQSLPYLIEFPYECSEQTFARIFANALGSKLLKDNPSLAEQVSGWAESDVSETPLFRNQAYKQISLQETPWVKNARSEEERKRRMAELLNTDSLNTHLTSAVEKLKQMQLYDGGFGWFSGSRMANHTITLHIVSGFGQMKKLGVSPETLEVNDLLYKALNYLDHEALKAFSQIEDKEGNTQLGSSTINYLYARSFFTEVEMSKELKGAMAYFLAEAKKQWVTQSLQLKAMLALAFDRFEDTESAERILTSLEETSTTSTEKGMYWLENESDYGWYKAPIETQALIIEAFETIGTDFEKTQNLQKWLLQNKRVNSWSTTKATTLAIYALLQNQKADLENSSSTSVSISGESIAFDESDSKLFLERSWVSDEIKPAMGSITIDNPLENPTWGALHYQFQQDVDEVEKQGGALKIERELYLIQQNGNQSKIDNATTLGLGVKVRVQLYLSVDREMEFVHLKDSRSVALEPVDVLSGYKNIGDTWAYQSVSDASMHFFIDRLPKGKHLITYDLVVNNAGTFSQGLSILENMYAPEFNARTKPSELKVIK